MGVDGTLETGVYAWYMPIARTGRVRLSAAQSWCQQRQAARRRNTAGARLIQENGRFIQTRTRRPSIGGATTVVKRTPATGESQADNGGPRAPCAAQRNAARRGAPPRVETVVGRSWSRHSTASTSQGSSRAASTQ